MTQRLPRIRLDSKHDEDLIGWLGELNHLPFGTKGQIIKQTLRRGLGVSSLKSKNLTEAFDSQELLSDIRQVVEASLESVVSRLSITPLTTTAPSLDVPDEIDALLDDFGANLMMLDEEDLDV